MKRRLYILLVAASFLMLIATVALYIRSFYVCDFIACEDPGTDYLIHDYGTSRGGVFIVEDIGGVRFLNGEEDDGPVPTSRRWSFEHNPAREDYHDDTTSIWGKLGYHYDEGAAHGVEWTYPLWPLLSLFALLPACYAIQLLRHRRRHAKGLCSQCGYDIRATPHRCPECGIAYPTNGTTS